MCMTIGHTGVPSYCHICDSERDIKTPNYSINGEENVKAFPKKMWRGEENGGSNEGGTVDLNFDIDFGCTGKNEVALKSS